MNEDRYQNLYSLLRSMIDTMTDMIWAKNLDKEFIFVNKAFASHFLNAKDTQEPIGKTDTFFATRERNRHPNNPEWHTFGEICRDTDSMTLEAMKEMQFDECGNIQGKFMYLDVHKAPLYNAEGELIGVVGSGRDVTEQKRYEDILKNNATNLNKTLRTLTNFMDNKSGKVNYNSITNTLKELSGAKYVVMNLIYPTYSQTVSISDLENVGAVCQKYLGMDIYAKKWQRNPDFEAKWTNQNVTFFPNLHDCVTIEFSESILQLIQKLFNLGESIIVKIEGKNGIIGNLLFVYSDKSILSNQELIELFSYQLGLFIERNRTDEALRTKMQDMERFHKLTVNRELKMIELKKEINELLREAGKEEKYRIVVE